MHANSASYGDVRAIGSCWVEIGSVERNSIGYFEAKLRESVIRASSVSSLNLHVIAKDVRRISTARANRDSRVLRSVSDVYAAVVRAEYSR